MPIHKKDYCEWCGTPKECVDLEEHHIGKRSLHPDQKKKPYNKIMLCKRPGGSGCHDNPKVLKFFEKQLNLDTYEKRNK